MQNKDWNHGRPTMDDVRLHLCNYKQLILTKGAERKAKVENRESMRVIESEKEWVSIVIV